MSRTKRLIDAWVALIIFCVVLPGMFYVTSYVIDSSLGFQPVFPAPYNIFGAALGLFAGFFWILWAYSYIHFVDMGTPVEDFEIALDPTKGLVTSGPYAYTRNPMTLGLILVFIGIAIYLRSLGGLVLVPVAIAVMVIYIKGAEEPALVRQFGRAYEDYRRSVAMLIPWRWVIRGHR